MRMKRREFLRYCLASAAMLGLPSCGGGGGSGSAGGGAGSGGLDISGVPNVVWLDGAACSGCTVSLANLISDSNPTDLGDLLINNINLAFHPTLMGAAGEDAVFSLQDASSEDFILVVEGGIPTAFGGHACVVWNEGGREVTAREAVLELAPQALAVLAVGTCASYGGVSGSAPNPTGIQSVSELTGLPCINIPGCPPHPDWMVYVFASLLSGQVPELDSYGRPLVLFPRGEDGTIHEHCPREDEDEVSRFGYDGRCLEELGCKGKNAHADCRTRRWNNRTQWCIGANAVCIACTEPGFPDQYVPFYRCNFS